MLTVSPGKTATAPAAALALAMVIGAASACSSPAAAGSAHRFAAGAVACSATSAPPPGVPVLTVAQLPAQAVTTLRLIAAGGPYPYSQDDTVYGNYSEALPRQHYGYYHEFTVVTPGSHTRGARRVVTGADGADYYTPDHYSTFDWISCAR